MAELTPEPSRRFARGPAADLWRRTLEQVPTTFGRLVFLASLRNQITGEYEHFGLAQAYGQEEAGRTLSESHYRVFAAWLCFDLEQQKEEIAAYLESLEGTVAPVISNWLRLAPYRNFVPADARTSERDLFLLDLETVLEMLRIENGVACPPDPES